MKRVADPSAAATGARPEELAAAATPAPPPKRPSLRGRLLTRLLPPLLVLFALSAATSYFAARHYANGVYDWWLQDSAEALALRVTTRRGEPVLDLPEAARQMLQWDSTDTTWFQIRGEQSGHLAGQLGLPVDPAGFGETGSVRRYDGRMGNHSVRVVSVTLQPAGGDEKVQIIVAETVRKREALAAELLLSILLSELVLVAVAIAIVSWTLGRLLSPIGSVAESLERQTHHSLEPVDDRQLPREVAPLTHAMNALLARLKDALSAQRQFVADAAHQLRTPITALKLYTDELAHEADPARQGPLLAELQRAADRTARLSNQLLALARAEPNARLRDPRRFDARAVVREAASHWVPAALAQGSDLGFDESGGADHGPAQAPASAGASVQASVQSAARAPTRATAQAPAPAHAQTQVPAHSPIQAPTQATTQATTQPTTQTPTQATARPTAPAEILGDPDLVAEAVHNLLDNALKYGRPHGRVTVSVMADRHTDRALISVTDDGPGIPGPERHRVVQRFQRLDRSPAAACGSRPDAPTGSGLGLSIVAEIARAHDGLLRVEDGPDGQGLRVTLDLPLAPP